MIPQRQRHGPQCGCGVCYASGMNFLAHLVLAGDDESLRLGAMLGDFVRGSAPLQGFSPGVRTGIRLHRHIDAFTDSLPAVAALRNGFPQPFRRYAGIVIDLLFDHELARRWHLYRDETPEAFDVAVRQLLVRHESCVPARLARFMAYADRRGLFAAYRRKSEVLKSLAGIGGRLSRPNPLHRVDEIWERVEPRAGACFEQVFAEIQSDVEAWLTAMSTKTGS